MKTSPTSTHSGGTGFSIRWDRFSLFGLGAVALLVAFITAITALFGAATWVVSGISLLVTVACYGALRGLVILDAKKRAREREHLTMSEGLETTIATYTTTGQTEDIPRFGNDKVFDFTETSEQLDEAPLEDQVEESVTAAPQPIPARKPLPRPMYLDAPEVEREAPEPLERPQDPSPSRGVQLSEGVSSQYQDKITEKANTRLDLDTVLNRRRAI